MGISYKDSGVDIDAGSALVDRIKKRVSKTFSPHVLTDIGGFGGLFQLPGGYKEPVLVSGCDGVGTKLKLAFASNRHNTIGIDLVAMSVNDILTSGARPLFFLDYLACSNLSSIPAVQIIEGIADGCEQAGCALLGGETAEMPDFYQLGEYDLAGFGVGLVDRGKIIDGKNIKAGDNLIGLASSGLHSNGFSLARHLLFKINNYDLNEKAPWNDQNLAETLLTPTRIYVRQIFEIQENCNIKGLVHITGGGLIDNLPRIMPDGLGVDCYKNSWDILPEFKFLNEIGEITETEMYRTFNMGIGMVLIVDPLEAEKTITLAQKAGEKAYLIGTVVKRAENEVKFV